MPSTGSEAPPRPEAAVTPGEKGGPEPKAEYIALLPQRVIRRLDSMATREHQSSRQRMLTWLADVYDQVAGAQADVLALDEERGRLEAGWRDLEQQQEALRTAILRDRRRLELSEEAYDFLHGALEAGYGKAELVAILQVCREAGVEPTALAAAIRDNLGLAEWGARLQAAAAQGEALRDQAIEQAGQYKHAAAQLEADVGALRAQIGQSQEQLAALQRHAQQLAETIHVLGLFVDVLGGQNVIDLPARAAKLVLGALILILGQLRPRACGPYLLQPNLEIGRMIPAPVLLTDLVPYLATPEDYRQMQQVLAQRQAVAEQFRQAAGTEPEEPPEAGEGGAST